MGRPASRSSAELGLWGRFGGSPWGKIPPWTFPIRPIGPHSPRDLPPRRWHPLGTSCGDLCMGTPIHGDPNLAFEIRTSGNTSRILGGSGLPLGFLWKGGVLAGRRSLGGRSWALSLQLVFFYGNSLVLNDLFALRKFGGRWWGGWRRGGVAFFFKN